MRLGTLGSIVLAAVITIPAAARGDQAPVNAELVGSWDGFGGTYADIWGEGDYAYLGHFGHAGVSIVDISNPAMPVEASQFLLPPPDTGASAQDVKVHDGILYIGVESGSSSVYIVDVRSPASPTMLTAVDVDGYRSIHNVFYSGGYLYMVDSGSNRVGIIDLTEFDPDNPPAGNITETKWILQGVGSSFVHDITVQGDRLYCAAWHSGLWVYDISNIANEPPVYLGDVDGQSTHSCWPTADGAYVVTGEERTSGGIQVYRVIDNGGSLDFELTDALALPVGQASSVHNQLIDGYRLYDSWYGAGLLVHDIDPDTGELVEVATYDTPGANWGVYPFLGEDRVLLSDMSNGLWVVHVDPDDPDLDGDGSVGAADLAILLNAWGPCPLGPCPADLNDDGQVDAEDLAILLANWG